MLLALFILLPKPENYQKINLSDIFELTQSNTQLKMKEAARPAIYKASIPTRNFEARKVHKSISSDTQSEVAVPIASTYQPHNENESYEISADKSNEQKGVISLSEGKNIQSITNTREIFQKGSDEIDISEILSYLTDKIEALKQYPYLARRKSIEGKVMLFVEIDRLGNLINTKIIKSSGYEILDQSALMLIKKAFPIKHNFNRDLRVTIPITYKLMR
jgi:TonB family protein